MVRRGRGADYDIRVTNPDGVMKGVRSVRVNGREVAGLVPVQPRGSGCIVEVELGQRE